VSEPPISQEPFEPEEPSRETQPEEPARETRPDDPSRETQPDSFPARAGEGAPPFYAPPEGEAAPAFYAPPLPPRDPFWGYHDLLIFLGGAPVALLLGAFLVKAIFAALRFKPAVTVMELLPEQFLGYVFLYAGLAALFRVWYARPFWHSMGWRPMRLPFSLIIAAGMVTGILVAVGAGLLHMKDEANPMTELMKGRSALILMAIFGVTVAPVAEELAFRGFLQPLLVRSVGPAFGVLLTAIPFGLLHFEEYGNSWAHVVMICLAGASFGVMRQITGSTKAAALMHASYNALFFMAAFSVGKDLPH
jgi:CAAX protease family protein